ncbi:hypothetical protein [Actinomadura kijaniata]|uniref:hypothetical protein n=1 Tax=Actinomadura kijaniata TaxID=46161 RepID=UPI00083025F8|nr:hypothetical protein [Actinomadura kijaniata]
MKRTVAVAAFVAGLGAAGARRVLSRAVGAEDVPNRWLTVTVNCPPESLAEGGRPEPLARLEPIAEIRITPAPGGRGTELAARLREPGPTGPVARATGDDPRQKVRSALREAKSLIETGEVMRPDAPPTTRSTPGGKLVELATRRAGGEGRL